MERCQGLSVAKYSLFCYSHSWVFASRGVLFIAYFLDLFMSYDIEFRTNIVPAKSNECVVDLCLQPQYSTLPRSYPLFRPPPE
jgi:hypothetical protein